MSLITLVGFGSQGAAWAECLRASGWDVRVCLNRKEGASYERALALGFHPRLPQDLATDLNALTVPHILIPMLCPDHVIAPFYREFLAPVQKPLTLVLAHGYAVYSGELDVLAPGHDVALLAPKAIGPKLAASFKEKHPDAHALVAAFQVPALRVHELLALAQALGFERDNLIPATFEQEAVGDLISEQGLLCGGLFTLLEHTIENMVAAGVPDRLIREECLTELELIAGLMRERGPSATFSAISQAAQCGTIAMAERLDAIGIGQALLSQANDVTSKNFIQTMRAPQWREKAARLRERFAVLESRWANPKKGLKS